MNLIFSIKSNFLKISVFTLSLIHITNSVSAARIDSLFRSDEIIKMELRSDFSAIREDRTENPEYHDGELIYYTPGSAPVKLFVKVMVRGNFRLNPVNCNFPPLFVDFKKSEVENTIFENQNILKLVTPCQLEEDVIEEYTIYKLYNQVTDLSMKVRLVKILYFDYGRNKQVFEKYSFFIEDKDRFAERNNAFVKDRFLTPFDLNKENLQRLSFFQYIIGNKDWYISSRKNIVILQSKDTTQELYAVPFDFDFSGFVNAEYTKSKGEPEEFFIERRVYKGLCYTEDELLEIFKFYREIRPVFESVINNQKLISNSDRKQILRYINHFYKVLENGELIKQEFMSDCETRKDYNLREK
ncbi:MAG: hypothetical protein NTW82_09605 [Bacteroidia bacterium]|nr:hypothetical protein [Bacteroidia bacterium]